MSLYTRLVAGGLFPLQEKLKHHSSVAWRRRLEKSQWQSPAEIEQLQLANLRRFLVRIGQQVPYYRSLFKALDFDPAAVTSGKDLARLPLLDKPTIRAQTEALKSEQAGNLQRFNTGGSSGEPLIFYLGNERVSHDVAAKWRATRWWNVDIGDPELVFWGSPIELGSQDRMRLLRDRLFRSQLLSAFDLTPERLTHFIQTLRDTRPKMLFGYPSVIAMVARYAREQGEDLSNLGVRVVFVTSEALYDYQREVIEAVFAAPVANGYGGRDAGFLAHQCPQGGMHLMAEDIVVEIVDAEGQPLPAGEVGEIVVTHTATGEFPFVRYRTGDMGALGAANCSCGRGLPLLEKLLGRSTDFVVATDGTRLHGLSLIYILRDQEGVESFKIVQESRQLTRILLVTNDHYQRQQEEGMRHSFRQRLGESVNIEFDYQPAIAAEASGKFRYVVSHAD